MPREPKNYIKIILAHAFGISQFSCIWISGYIRWLTSTLHGINSFIENDKFQNTESQKVRFCPSHLLRVFQCTCWTACLKLLKLNKTKNWKLFAGTLNYRHIQKRPATRWRLVVVWGRTKCATWEYLTPIRFCIHTYEGPPLKGGSTLAWCEYFNNDECNSIQIWQFYKIFSATRAQDTNRQHDLSPDAFTLPHTWNFAGM